MAKRKTPPSYDKGWKAYLNKDERTELTALETKIDLADNDVAQATEKRKALIVERHVLQNRATARRRRSEA